MNRTFDRKVQDKEFPRGRLKLIEIEQTGHMTHQSHGGERARLAISYAYKLFRPIFFLCMSWLLQYPPHMKEYCKPTTIEYACSAQVPAQTKH